MTGKMIATEKACEWGLVNLVTSEDELKEKTISW